MKEANQGEWWTFWGIIILAAKVGVGGVTCLYDKTPKIIEQLPGIDLTEIMKQYRFEKLMQLMPMAFHGDDYNDPRNHVLALIEGFNSNCAKKTAASHIKVADETMSAYLPTTTKWGGLPFLSFILRKPQPLGTDFNSCACVETSEINKNLENHSNF